MKQLNKLLLVHRQHWVLQHQEHRKADGDSEEQSGKVFRLRANDRKKLQNSRNNSRAGRISTSGKVFQAQRFEEAFVRKVFRIIEREFHRKSVSKARASH